MALESESKAHLPHPEVSAVDNNASLDSAFLDNIILRMQLCQRNDNTNNAQRLTPSKEADDSLPGVHCDVCCFPKYCKRGPFLYHRFLCPCDVDLVVEGEPSWLSRTHDLIQERQERDAMVVSGQNANNHINSKDSEKSIWCSNLQREHFEDEIIKLNKLLEYLNADALKSSPVCQLNTLHAESGEANYNNNSSCFNTCASNIPGESSDDELTTMFPREDTMQNSLSGFVLSDMYFSGLENVVSPAADLKAQQDERDLLLTPPKYNTFNTPYITNHRHYQQCRKNVQCNCTSVANGCYRVTSRNGKRIGCRNIYKINTANQRIHKKHYEIMCYDKLSHERIYNNFKNIHSQGMSDSSFCRRGNQIRGMPNRYHRYHKMSGKRCKARHFCIGRRNPSFSKHRRSMMNWATNQTCLVKSSHNKIPTHPVQSCVGSNTMSNHFMIEKGGLHNCSPWNQKLEFTDGFYKSSQREPGVHIFGSDMEKLYCSRCKETNVTPTIAINNQTYITRNVMPHHSKEINVSNKTANESDICLTGSNANHNFAEDKHVFKFSPPKIALSPRNHKTRVPFEFSKPSVCKIKSGLDATISSFTGSMSCPLTAGIRCSNPICVNNSNNNERPCSNNSCVHAPPPLSGGRDQLKGRVVKVEGDGRCLFRSLVTAEFPDLQAERRDDFGRPKSLEMAQHETSRADLLRARVVSIMAENMHFYSQLGKTLINADQPASSSYGQFRDRLSDMSQPTTMPGDLELNALALVLERQILVLDTKLALITSYGADRFPRSGALAVRFTRLGPDVGHYDAVILEGDHTGMDCETTLAAPATEGRSYGSSVDSGLCGHFRKLTTSEGAGGNVPQIRAQGDPALKAKREFFYLRDYDKALHTEEPKSIKPTANGMPTANTPKLVEASTSTTRAVVHWSPKPTVAGKPRNQVRYKTRVYTNKCTQTDLEDRGPRYAAKSSGMRRKYCGHRRPRSRRMACALRKRHGKVVSERS